MMSCKYLNSSKLEFYDVLRRTISAHSKAAWKVLPSILVRKFKQFKHFSNLHWAKRIKYWKCSSYCTREYKIILEKLFLCLNSASYTFQPVWLKTITSRIKIWKQFFQNYFVFSSTIRTTFSIFDALCSMQIWKIFELFKFTK